MMNTLLSTAFEVWRDITSFDNQLFLASPPCSCPVWHFVQEQLVPRIVMKSVVDIHGPQWMISKVFSDLQTLPCDVES